MSNWLQYFFLSFFSDKYTHEAHKRSLLNGFGCFFLSLIILLSLLFGGYMVAMPVHYRNANNYREAIYDILGDSNYIIQVEDGNFAFSDHQGTAVVINSFSQQVANNCELIIDTRDIDSIFTTFSVQYIKKDGTVLPYEKYLALPEDEQANYLFSVEYSDIPICFTDDLLSSFEQYLSTVKDEDVWQDYTDLLTRKQSLEENEYAVALYKLYVTAYYPSDVQALDLYSFAPTLRTYYDSLIKSSNTQFFVMYRDLIYTRFFGQGDICYTVTAPSAQIDTQSISDGDKAKEEAQIDQLITDAFLVSASTIFIEYIFNIVKLFSLLMIGALLISVLPWLLWKLIKDHKYAAYLTSFQILLLYTPVAAIIGGLTGFVLSWYVGRNTTYQVAVLCYMTVASCRMILYTLVTLFRGRSN